MKFNKKIFIIISLIVLVGAAAFYWQNLSYSKQALKLEILGPDKADMGQSLEYTVKFKNNGEVRLTNPDLFFQFPDGALLEDSQQKVMHLDSEDLGGDIYPGEERSFKFTTRLLGKENETKQMMARMSFQPAGLKTTNEVKTTFTTILGKVPINLLIEMSDQAAAGKALTIRINYSSNVPYPLRDLTCKMDLPDDFTLQYSNPKGLDNQWDIPILNEAGAGRIELSGILNGQANDQKVFKAQIGIWQNGSFIVLKDTVRGVQIIAPSIYLTQKINNSDTYVASSGDQLHYEINFLNTGTQPMQNLVLISRLNSSNVNLNSIKVPDGAYQQGDNSIIWDGSKIPELQYLDVGQQGKVEFWVDINNRWAMKSLADKNPVITNRVTVGPTNQSFLTKINSSLAVEQKIYNTNQYFTNSGPYPLEIGRKTYLTVEWKAKNYYNDIEGAQMRAVLSPNVSFENQIWPSEAKITYDENTREVFCDIGSLPAGTGLLNDSIICAFQVSVTPELAEDTLIVGSVQITGNDQWTGKQLQSVTEPIYALTVIQ
ncbi:MAG: hypothetical protein WC303_03650 [Candidatus Paceibacterota bacterium]|jgi:uncharacterized repeat protein (TIGR01451 family)